MPARPARPRRARRPVALGGALVAAGALLVLIAAVPTARPASAATATVTGPGGLSVTTTPADLSTVRSGDRVHLHFAGLDATSYVDFVGNCPSPFPVPESALSTGGQLANACLASFDTGLQGAVDATTGQNLAVSKSVRSLYPAKDGTVDLDYLVGTGTSLGSLAYQLVFADGRAEVRQASMTCGPTAPCSIGFAVRSTRSGLPTVSWLDLHSLVVTPAPLSTGDGGCRAADAGTVAAVGPERGQQLLSALNRGACGAAPGPLPVDYVANGEARVADVGSGVDLALAGSALLSAPDAPAPTADRVLVPIGLSATVLGEIGGPPRQDSLYPGRKAYSSAPLPPLSLTASDAARVVLHDYPAVSSPAQVVPGSNTLATALESRPGGEVLRGFDRSGFGLPLNYAPTVTYPDGVDSTPAALGSWLSTTAGAAWRYPDLPPNAAAGRVGDAVGTPVSFSELVDPGLASDPRGLPRLTSAVSSVGSIYSALFGKDIGAAVAYDCPAFPSVGEVIPTSLSQGCLRFVVADAGTVRALDLPTAALQNASGAYVAPTAASLQAAADGAQPGPDGVLRLPATAPGAYPLTFVEYAVVPAAPLLTSDCVPRTAQQQRLAAFLTYATGPGQAALPPGLAPLPPALQEVAAAAVARVGASAAKGACAPAPTPTPTVPPAPLGSSSASSGGSSYVLPSGSTGASALDGGLDAAVLTPVVGAPAAPAPQVASTTAVDAAARALTLSPTGRSGARPLVGLGLLVLGLATAGLGAAGRLPVPRRPGGVRARPRVRTGAVAA